jgi:hypothetical protein
MFMQKHGIFRPAGGASGRSPGETPGLMNHRVTRITNTTYAVIRRQGFAGGETTPALL